MILAVTFIFPWPLWIYLVASGVAFVLYFMDKYRATHGRWRISEATLHLCELLGGWPGAFVAQRFFRHKNRKHDYMLVFWLIVALHGVFWAWRLGWLRV